MFPNALPHGTISPVVDAVFLVRGTFRMGPGLAISRTMTVVVGDDGLVIVAPMWRKLQKVQGVRVKEAFKPLAAQSFANLVTGHGPAVVGGADARVRSAIEAASA